MPRFFDFDIELEGASPRVWRRFLLEHKSSFADLHDAIQIATGWQDKHLHVFIDEDSGEELAGHIATADDNVEPVDMALSTWFTAARRTIRYAYDFGDDWQMLVTLRGVVSDKRAGQRFLLDGARAFPLEDCGGLSGYERCCAFVRDGIDDDDHTLKQWLPSDWHPDRFDRAAVQDRFDARPKTEYTPPATLLPTVARPATNPWCARLELPAIDVAAALAHRRNPPLAIAEFVVLVLLEYGAPMAIDDVVRAVDALRPGRAGPQIKRELKKGNQAFAIDHGGRLVLVDGSELRRALFVLWGVRDTTFAHLPVEERYAADQRAEAARAARETRVVIDAIPTVQAATAIATLDVRTGARLLFDITTDDGRAAFAAHVVLFDVVVGAQPHHTLGLLDIDASMFKRVVELLLPSNETSSVEAIARRTLHHAFPTSMATLFALYRYAVLHGGVWGKSGRWVPNRAGAPGELNIYTSLRAAHEQRRRVCIWSGPPPEHGASWPPAHGIISTLHNREYVELERSPRLNIDHITALGFDGHEPQPFRLPW